MNVPESLAPITPQGGAIATLFWLALAISALIFALVVGVLTVALVRDRARPGDPDPEQVHGNRTLEITWTAVPALILAVMFVLTVRTMVFADAEEASPLRVQVIGHQWWWEYRYPDFGIVTANELYLPVGRQARLEQTSADVVHDFWVPQFGRKRDLVPNLVNATVVSPDQVGTFRGFCAEFCGTQHAWMQITAVTQPADQFEAWVRGQQAPAPPPSDPTQARGLELFTSNTCANCHAIAGTAAAARVGPDLSHVGSRATLGAGVVGNSPEALQRWIRDPQAIKPGVLMPGYPNLSDADLAALAAYLSSRH
jgi:cytochrome c oxidase subunit II